jgi:hypothetical protein
MSEFSRRAFAKVAASGLLLGGAMAWLGGTPRVGASDKEKEHNPHIRHALEELREARKELKESDHDFDGHRDEALEAVDRAIRLLDTCSKHDRR